ncbi:MAG TPA: RAMP superfamily CRISPR-associated protein [Chloroflexota bacterium]|jgi:hypothetical protein|nr:RAMP superfamily CRISPR-associated protein [Chloroflexota bacterium]
MPWVEIALTVELRSALSTSGRAAHGSVVARDLARDGWGRLILPASHLKGRLRHACRQVAHTLGLASCPPAHADAACPLCALFGAPGQPGALRWRDLPCLAAPEPASSLADPLAHSPAVPRGGLALSRARGVAASAHWRPTTLPLPAQLRFGHPQAIVGMVPAVAPIHLLLAGCRLLGGVGQGRSRGLGWAQVQAEAWVDGAPLAADPHALGALRVEASALVGEAAP